MNNDTNVDVVSLLKTWPERKRKIAVLHFELANFTGVRENEALEAMALGHSDGIGYSSGHISDKTFYIALNYQSKADKMNSDSKEELVTELVRLERDQERLDYYISLLNERQAKVIKFIYCERKPQGQVEKIMGLSSKTVRKLKEEALNALAEMYQFVSKLS